MAQIEIKITRQRVEETVTVDEMIQMQEGSMKAAKSVVSRFVVDPATGAYMDEAQASQFVGKMTIAQLKGLLQEFGGSVEQAVVPLMNSGASD